jgi:ABC-2 type transport system permease protein
MLRLLKIEFQKLKPYPTFWVLIGLIAGLFLTVALVASQINTGMFGFNLSVFFTFPVVWNTFSWLASWFNLLLAILIIIITGNEYTFRTFRQNVVDGLTRVELLQGKMIIILSLSIGMVLLVFVFSVIAGFIYTVDLSLNNFFTGIYILFIYFIQSMAYMAFAFLICILLKNTALAIVVYFAYAVFEFIIRIYFKILEIPAWKYFPMNVISNLTPMPSIGPISNNLQMQGMPVNADASIQLSIIITIIYTSIFIFLSFRILNKRNL